MSREFGSYQSGYFWYQMQVAAEDCLQGSDELTRLWGKFFQEFEKVAYSIASSEAGDSGPSDPIFENIRMKEPLARALRNIEKYIEKYEEVAQKAVRDHINKEVK